MQESPHPSPRILIVDRQPITRAGYRRIFDGELPYGEIGEAGSTRDALRALRGSAWDLVLMDLALLDPREAALLESLERRFPDSKFLVVNALPESQSARRALRAGARGYVSKASPAAELLLAVHTVLAGRRYISPTLAEYMASDLDATRDRTLEDQLSPRELQVFARLAAGTSVSCIGREFGLSVKTVSTYRVRLLKKMGFGCNADITAYAMRHGII